MRIRTIKPEFFKDEYVAELSSWARLLYIGLWGLADRDGRLEDRPKRIKVEVLPYDDQDVDALLKELAQHQQKFIIRYEVEDTKVIQIRTFSKHQRLTSKELEIPSLLPKLEPDLSTGTQSSHTRDIPGAQPGHTEDISGTTGKEGKGKEEEGEGGSTTTTTGMLTQVKRIKAIRKEFEALRDVDIENALKEYPAEFWESGISDFERDMIGALEIPPIPVKKLRGYLYRAAKDGARLRSDATPRQVGDRTPGIENLSAEELAEWANDAVARKALQSMNGNKTTNKTANTKTPESAIR